MKKALKEKQCRKLWKKNEKGFETLTLYKKAIKMQIQQTGFLERLGIKSKRVWFSWWDISAPINNSNALIEWLEKHDW